MDFSFKDGKRLCSLLRRQEALVDKKRRWLESMIPKLDGCSRRVKRPRFLADAYVVESDIRSEEVSCEKVRASVAKSFSSQYDGYNHHLVLDGLSLFNLQRGGNGSLSPETLNIMHSTINKLSNEALQSVATIISHFKYTSSKTRPILRKVITDHLPSYLAQLDNEDTVMSQLSKILCNPCSYQSDCLNLVTPVSPVLLSSINQALDGLDGISEQALVAVNRRLIGKSCSPKFWYVPRSSNRWNLIETVRKKCKKIIARLPTEEGHYLPKKLGKAMSVINLYRKQKLRCMDISQLEFFPFSKQTISLQNDVLNALWSLPKIKHAELKLLHPIFGQGSKVRKMHFKVALRSYLIECLFECDEGDLPDEALRAISFINRISQCGNVVLKEEKKDEEVEAVLNVSSHLRALAYYDTEECSGDDGLMSLGSDICSEDNGFIVSETGYFQFNSEQQLDVPCCSSNTAKSADMNECSGETVPATHDVPKAGFSDSKSAEVYRKPCKMAEDIGTTPHYGDDESLENAVHANHLKTSMPSKILSEICDETSTAAHMLIGQILDKWLLMENVEVDELTRHYLGGGLVSQGPQDARELPNVAEENQKGDVLAHAVERTLPTLPKRFEQLQVLTRLYPKGTRCDVTLRYCGLSAPEGSLAQSVVSEGKSNALDVSFVRAPIGMDLDWQLVAKLSPCHVTVLKGSYERFLDFIKRSNAVSPTVAIETATALQMKLEQVTRRAQEQLQMVLEEQSRFGLDIDLDAPKVRIPLTTGQPCLGNEHFVLDLGHFTLQQEMEHGMKKDRVCIHAFILRGGTWLLFLFVMWLKIYTLYQKIYLRMCSQVLLLMLISSVLFLIAVDCQ